MNDTQPTKSVEYNKDLERCAGMLMSVLEVLRGLMSSNTHNLDKRDLSIAITHFEEGSRAMNDANFGSRPYDPSAMYRGYRDLPNK